MKMVRWSFVNSLLAAIGLEDKSDDEEYEDEEPDDDDDDDEDLDDLLEADRLEDAVE